jgi:hypothetical protein
LVSTIARVAADRKPRARRAVDTGDRLMSLTRPGSIVFDPPNTKP